MSHHLLFPAVLLVLASCNSEGQASSSQQQPQEPKTPPAPKVEYAGIEKTGDPAIDALADFVAEKKIDKNRPGWKTALPKPPQVEFAEGKTYFWNLATNKGGVKIKLLPDAAPMHVSSTIYLTKLGYYDDLSFHRVIPGFMAQGGCPLGTGTGGPGYQYGGEFLVHCPNPECKNEYFGTEKQEVARKTFFVCPKCKKLSAPVHQHDRPGLLSMANADDPTKGIIGTDGSQFFLTFVPTPWLDCRHTIFGEVVDGSAALDALEKCGTKTGTPTEPLRIERAFISIETE